MLRTQVRTCEFTYLVIFSNFLPSLLLLLWTALCELHCGRPSRLKQVTFDASLKAYLAGFEEGRKRKEADTGTTPDKHNDRGAEIQPKHETQLKADNTGLPCHQRGPQWTVWLRVNCKNHHKTGLQPLNLDFHSTKSSLPSTSRRPNTVMLSGLTCSVLILLVRLRKCFHHKWTNHSNRRRSLTHTPLFFALNASERWTSLELVSVFIEHICLDVLHSWYGCRIKGTFGAFHVSASCKLNRKPLHLNTKNKRKKKSLKQKRKQSNDIMTSGRLTHSCETVAVKC